MKLIKKILKRIKNLFSKNKTVYYQPGDPIKESLVSFVSVDVEESFSVLLEKLKQISDIGLPEEKKEAFKKILSDEINNSMQATTFKVLSRVDTLINSLPNEQESNRDTQRESKE